jgi:hypothetical protein
MNPSMPALVRHLPSLESQDRRFRFGAPLADSGVASEAMLHLARRQYMTIVTEAGEADAWLALPPADAATFLGEVFTQRVALFDYALKSQLAHAPRTAVADFSFSHGRRD